jgi:hypothetical protein
MKTNWWSKVTPYNINEVHYISAITSAFFSKIAQKLQLYRKYKVLILLAELSF